MEALINGRVATPVAVSSVSPRSSYIEYALDISAGVDGSYSFLLNSGAPLTDVYGNPVWCNNTLGLWVDRTAPVVVPQTYGSRLYVGDTYLVGGSPPGAALPLPVGAMFSDAVSSQASLLSLISISAVGDGRGFVPYTYQPGAPHALTGAEGYLSTVRGIGG